MQMQHAEGAFGAFETFLGTPLPDNPHEALGVLRKEAAAEVERLLALLDAIEGDPDLEPSLGYLPYNADPTMVNAEADDADAEPSLAFPETVTTPLYPAGVDIWSSRDGIRRTGAGSQRSSAWVHGGGEDLEGDPLEDHEDGHDAEDDRADDEYSLGWTEAIRQDRRADGGWFGDDEQMLASTPAEDATRLASPVDHDGEDGHDAEYVCADELGVADYDALAAEDCFFSGGGSFDGTGQEIAKRLLTRAGVR